jgi:hypothetical protein
VWLLSFLLYFGVISILFLKKVDVPDRSRRLPVALMKQGDPVFIGAGILFVLAHIYPTVFLPLRTWSDESSYASSGMQMLEAMRPGLAYSSSKFRIVQLLSRLIVLTGIIAAVKYRPWKYLEKFTAKRKIVSLTVTVVLLSHILFFLLKDAHFYAFLYKPPALSRWLFLGVTALAPTNVFWVRLPSMLFCLLSSVLIYEIVTFLGHRDIARMAAALFLFFPNVFHYSCSTVLGCGTVFFGLLPLYFLIYFLKTKDYWALHWCFFWAATGFLWKRTLITGEIYLIIILVLYHVFVDRISLKKAIPYWLFSLGVIIPFFLIGQFLPELPFDAAKLGKSVGLFPLLHFAELSRYLSLMPRQITFAGLGLFCAGLFFFLMRKEYFRKFWPLAVAFLCWYVVLTMSLKKYPPTHCRWQLPLYPFVAICTAFCFRFLMSKWRKAGVVVFSGYLVFMVMCCTVLRIPPVRPEFASYRTDFPNPTHLGGFLPYEKMILYMKKHLPVGSKILADDFPDPREFYSFKHQLNMDWKLVKSPNQLAPGIKGLYEKAKKDGASYLFLPEPAYSRHMYEPALDAVFEGDTDCFSRVMVFYGPSGRVGLFNVK